MSHVFEELFFSLKQRVKTTPGQHTLFIFFPIVYIFVCILRCKIVQKDNKVGNKEFYNCTNKLNTK